MTPAEISAAWASPEQRPGIARSIAKHKTFEGFSLGEVEALIGPPNETVPSNSDAMSPTYAGGRAWRDKSCSPSRTCLYLSLEIRDGHVIGASGPRD